MELPSFTRFMAALQTAEAVTCLPAGRDSPILRRVLFHLTTFAGKSLSNLTREQSSLLARSAVFHCVLNCGVSWTKFEITSS